LSVRLRGGEVREVAARLDLALEALTARLPEIRSLELAEDVLALVLGRIADAIGPLLTVPPPVDEWPVGSGFQPACRS